MQDNCIEMKIVTSPGAVEPVEGIYYGMNVLGVAIEDPNDIYSRKQEALAWDFADMNIFEYGEGAAVVKGYFSIDENPEELKAYIEEKLSELKDMGIDIGSGIVTSKCIKEHEWATEWKKYYKTTRLGKTLIIKPTWEEYKQEPYDNIIEMDPGMAFGTGTHETTMMCCELLEKYVRKDSTVFDIGTGSGILAIVASKLGAKSVTAVDLDEVAVDAAKKNVELNHADNINVCYGNLTDVVTGKADIVVANIIADVIIFLSDSIGDFLNEDGLFICSGIINERKDDVVKALVKNRMDVVEIRQMGEWTAITARV